MINVTKTTLPPLSEYNKYLKKIWKNNWVTNQGEFSIKFEKKLEKYLGMKYIMPVSNGTLAMQLAFKALDLKGEVITTPFTFPATTNALIWEGLTPVFADIDPNTFNIDPKSVEKKITNKTSAILAVHVFGNPCDVESLDKIAKKHKLKLIYDSAHAFAVEYGGKTLMEWGEINTLSFHAAKIFHTVEGGAVTARNKNIKEKLYLLSNHGILNYEEIVLAGTNAKMNELQAAMGLCLLKSYNQEISKRKKIYETYLNAFGQNDSLKTQKLNEKMTKYTYPYFPICFATEKVRDNVYKTLLRNGIRARKYFYPPCHEFPYIREKSSNYPNATKISHSILCLPLYSTLPIGSVKKVISIIKKELG